MGLSRLITGFGDTEETGFLILFYISSPTPHMNFRLPILTPPLPLKKGGFEKGSRNAYYFFEGNNSRILIQYFSRMLRYPSRDGSAHIKDSEFNIR